MCRPKYIGQKAPTKKVSGIFLYEYSAICNRTQNTYKREVLSKKGKNKKGVEKECVWNTLQLKQKDLFFI